MFQARWLIVSVIIAIMGGLILYVLTPISNKAHDKPEPTAHETKLAPVISNKHMEIKSKAFENNGLIPRQFTCDGIDINPPLEIRDVPEKAQSLVLIMDDPDVPKETRDDGVWDHWIVFNIPSGISVIGQGSEPTGVHGTGTSGNKEYQGPCPPDGEHRYFFKLYALDVDLILAEGVSKNEVEKAMEGHIVDEAELIGRYSR